MIRVQQAGRGLGTDIVLTLFAANEATAKQLFQVLWANIHSFEKRFSRFLPESELTAVTQSAGKETVVSEEFAALLKVALEASERTKGLYNPLILPALQTAGYKGSWPATDQVNAQTDYTDRQHVGDSRNIQLKNNAVTLPANTALDFGGIGKGYLLDQLANYLDTQHVRSYWLSLGGDIVLKGTDTDGQPWAVGIADVQDDETPIAFIRNATGKRMAIATSGITKRKGQGWHHIIDPRTGQSAVTDVLSATAVTVSATDADVLAKCAVLTGSADAQTFFETFKLDQLVLQITEGNTSKTVHLGSNS